MDVGNFLKEFGLAVLGALATLGASYLAIHASRRDRIEDKHAKTEERLNRHGIELRNLNDGTGIKSKFPDYPADKL